MTSGSEQSVVRLVRRLDAAPDRVFRAWTEPADLRRWAWGGIGGDVDAEVDLRVGGTYRIVNVRQGREPEAFTGEYLEVVPGRRLVYTVRWEADMGYEPVDERITVELADRGGATEVVFEHAGGFPAEACPEHEKGWASTFDALAELLHEDAK